MQATLWEQRFLACRNQEAVIITDHPVSLNRMKATKAICFSRNKGAFKVYNIEIPIVLILFPVSEPRLDR